MAGIEKFIQKIAVQTAVYWGSPTNSGYGGYTYATPVEIGVRWEDVKETFVDKEGKETVSRAKIFVTQDLDEDGYLYLGTLDDFDSTVDTDAPREIVGCFPIKRFDKIPMIRKTDEFVRLAYLTNRQ